jgi:hypothetical protein
VTTTSLFCPACSKRCGLAEARDGWVVVRVREHFPDEQGRGRLGHDPLTLGPARLEDRWQWPRSWMCPHCHAVVSLDVEHARRIGRARTVACGGSITFTSEDDPAR